MRGNLPIPLRYEQSCGKVFLVAITNTNSKDKLMTYYFCPNHILFIPVEFLMRIRFVYTNFAIFANKRKHSLIGTTFRELVVKEPHMETDSRNMMVWKTYYLTDLIQLFLYELCFENVY